MIWLFGLLFLNVRVTIGFILYKKGICLGIWLGLFHHSGHSVGILWHLKVPTATSLSWPFYNAFASRMLPLLFHIFYLEWELERFYSFDLVIGLRSLSLFCVDLFFEHLLWDRFVLTPIIMDPCAIVAARDFFQFGFPHKNMIFLLYSRISAFFHASIYIIIEFYELYLPNNACLIV